MTRSHLSDPRVPCSAALPGMDVMRRGEGSAITTGYLSPPAAIAYSAGPSLGPDAMSVQIRRATPADAQALSLIAIATYTETFGDSYPPQDLQAFLHDHYSLAPQQRELQDPRSAVWLLEDAGQAIGYLAAGANGLPHPEARSEDVELKRLYVLASHQGSGHGARLMDAFMAWLDQPARRTLWVGVWSENYGAQRFYARYGCVQVGSYDFVVGDSRDLEFILRRR